MDHLQAFSYQRRIAKLDQLQRLMLDNGYLVVDAVIEGFGEQSFHEAVPSTQRICGQTESAGVIINEHAG